MGMDLTNLNLLSLQTKFMQQDPVTIGLCIALQPIFDELANEVKLCILYANIDNLASDVIDILANDMHIDWYDANASVLVKRQIVKNSMKIHQRRGTVAAVEEVIQQYFGSGTIKEWFEYGGTPYTFKVIVKNQAVSGELISQFTKAVNSVKNVRSFMEEILIGILWEEFDLKNLTWDQLDANNLTWDHFDEGSWLNA